MLGAAERNVASLGSGKIVHVCLENVLRDGECLYCSPRAEPTKAGENNRERKHPPCCSAPTAPSPPGPNLRIVLSTLAIRLRELLYSFLAYFRLLLSNKELGLATGETPKWITDLE